MNFLGHFVLSGIDEKVIIGNFMGDFLPGRKFRETFAGEPGIIRGVELHRFIDSFTDNSPAVKQSVARLREHHGKYSPVIVDVLYDHLLAANFEDLFSESLNSFSERMYEVIHRNRQFLMPQAERIFQNMRRDNWLLHYRERWGLEKSLQGLAYRARFTNNITEADKTLYNSYADFEADFKTFFPEIMKAVNARQNAEQV